jgi:hypothetical protein
MRMHTHKTAGQAIKGAGVPALPLIFPRVNADGKNKVRKSLAGRSPSMGELRGWTGHARSLQRLEFVRL